MVQRDAVVRRLWLLFLMEIWKRGNTILHPGSDFVDGFATRSAEAGVARPPREARRQVRWNPTADVAGPHALCVVVTTARQPVYGPNPVVSPCWLVCGVAAALGQWVPHSGGLLWRSAVCFS